MKMSSVRALNWTFRVKNYDLRGVKNLGELICWQGAGIN